MSWLVYHSGFAVRKKIRLELLTLHTKRNNKIIQSHIFPQFIFHSFVPAFLVSIFECNCANCVHSIYYAQFLCWKTFSTWPLLPLWDVTSCTSLIHTGNVCVEPQAAYIMHLFSYKSKLFQGKWCIRPTLFVPQEESVQ